MTISLPLIGQSINKSERDALNAYVQLINHTAVNLSKTIECLDNYYTDVENAKQRKRDLYKNYVCLHPINSFFIENIEKNSKHLPPKYLKNIDIETKKLINKYENILKKCRELEIYIKLKDYKTDNYSTSDKILKSVSDLFLDFRFTKRALESEIFRIYRKLQPYKASNKIHYAENDMRKYIAKEKSLMDLWSHNLNKKVPSACFPADSFVLSVNKLEKEAQEVDCNNYKYTLDHFCKLFYAEKRSIIPNLKRRFVDGYNFHEQQNDVFSNRAYQTMLNYLNNSLIGWFNSFVKDAAGKGTNIILSCKYLPVFIIQRTAKYPTLKPIVYIESPAQKVSIESQKNDISDETVKSLNNYIVFLNEEIRSQNHFIYQLESFNVEINRKHKKVFEKENMWFTTFDAIPQGYNSMRSEYEKALNNSDKVPKKHAKILNQQVESIWQIINEREQLAIKLYHYSKNRNFMNDSFAFATKALKRFDYLNKQFIRHKTKLFNDIILIFSQYHNSETDNPWVKSASVLSKIVDRGRAAVQATKPIIRKNDTIQINIDTLSQLARQALIDKYKNIDGLVEYGRNNGLCPYSYYDDIPKDTKLLGLQATEVGKKLKTKKSMVRLYDSYVNTYKHIVDDFNRFVDLAKGEQPETRHKGIAPVYLLYQLYEPLFFDYSAPDKEIETKIDTNKLFASMDGYAVNNLVLLLDVSASMESDNKLPLLKKSLQRLLKIMRPEDEIAIVTYSGKARVALKPTSAQDQKLLRAIDKLKSKGSTKTGKGIKLAFKMAAKNFKPDGNNRIILATDGKFGITKEIKNTISNFAQQGIVFSLFLYGQNIRTYENSQLKALTQAGKGNCRFITPENTDEMLVKEAKAIKKTR